MHFPIVSTLTVTQLIEHARKANTSNILTEPKNPLEQARIEFYHSVNKTLHHYLQLLKEKGVRILEKPGDTSHDTLERTLDELYRERVILILYRYTPDGHKRLLSQIPDLEKAKDINDIIHLNSLIEDTNVIFIKRTSSGTTCLFNNHHLTRLPIKTITELRKKRAEELFLEDNFIRFLPEEIGSLEQLSLLSLDGNQLEELPDGMSRLTQLSYLDVENNQLTTLPDSLRHLSKLNKLYLGKNQFDIGSLPASLRPLLSRTQNYLYLPCTKDSYLNSATNALVKGFSGLWTTSHSTQSPSPHKSTRALTFSDGHELKRAPASEVPSFESALRQRSSAKLALQETAVPPIPAGQKRNVSV